MTVDHVQNGPTVVRTSRGDMLQFHQTSDPEQHPPPGPEPTGIKRPDKMGATKGATKPETTVWIVKSVKAAEFKLKYHADPECHHLKGHAVEPKILPEEPPEEMRCQACSKKLGEGNHFGVETASNSSSTVYGPHCARSIFHQLGVNKLTAASHSGEGPSGSAPSGQKG